MQRFCMLPDGTYDAFVLDAEALERGTGGAARVEVAVTSGPSKGHVVVVRGDVGTADTIDLLGLPVTLVVESGVPRLVLG